MTDGVGLTQPSDQPGSPTSTRRGLVSTLLRGGSWQALAQFAPLVVNLVVTPYVIHGLGLTRYGLFILVNTIIGFLGSFDGGIGASAQRYFAVYAGTDDRFATTRLLTTLVAVVSMFSVSLFVIIFFVIPLVLPFFHVPGDLLGEGVFLVRTLSFVVAFGLLRGLFSSVLGARQRFALASITSVLSYVVYIAGVVYSVESGHALRGIAITFVAQSAFAALVIVPSAMRYLVRGGVSLLPVAEIRAFLKYAVKVQASGLMTLINTETDALIIGAVLPVRNVGIYGTGANFASQLRRVTYNVLSPIQSVLGRSVGRVGAEAALVEFHRVQRLWVVFVTGWCSVALGAVYFGVTAWLGPSLRLAGVVSTVLMAGHLVNLWTGTLSAWVRAVGKPELEAWYGFVGVVLNLVLTVALIFPFGILGVVIATASGQVLGSLYFQVIARRRLGGNLRPFVAEVPVIPGIVAAAATVGLEAVLHPFVPQGAVGLLLSGLVAAPPLALFFVMTLGPRRTWSLLVGRLTTLRRGPKPSTAAGPT